MAFRQSSCQIVWEPTAGVYKLNAEINWDDPLQKGMPSFFKAIMPASDRVWEPATKTWYLSEKFFPKVRDYCQMAFGNLFIYTKEQSEEFTKQQQQYEQSYYQQTVHNVDRYKSTFVDILLKHRIISGDMDIEADWNNTIKVYRRACLVLHPDRNPSGAEDMSKLNEAWSYIKAEKEQQNG